MRSIVTLLLGTAMVAALSVPFAVAGAATVGNPLVLELFTSEGCSSCPPADQYLRELKRERPDFLVLDFHINYWDNLGWKDPFSLREATDRQQAYDSLLNSEVYTPQLVVGGSHQVVGSNRDAVTDAIAAAYQDRGATKSVALTLAPAGPDLAVNVGTGSGSGRLWLVGYDDEHTTNIGRGENSGLTETEVDIVRSIRPVGDWGGNALHLTVGVPSGQRAAILLQRPDGRIISAAVLGSATT